MKLIPLFPLEIVVFSYEKLNLHIFEPRYKELISDCVTQDLSFGIPFYRENFPLKYGTEVKLLEISKTYQDGRMDIKTEGISCFEIKKFRKKMPEKSYPGGYVLTIINDFNPDKKLRNEIKSKLESLYQFMNIIKNPIELENDFLIYEIAHKIGLNTEQEYELLQIYTEVERQQYVLRHLERMIPLVKEAENMRQKIQLNGHFKSFDPPNF